MSAKQSILMFPWLAHGHVYPFLELAKKLSKKNFHIYFISTPIILDSIRNASINKDSSDKDDGFAIEFVELRLPSSPELPPHYHTTKNIPAHLIPTLMIAAKMSGFSDIIANLKPDLVIYDAFQPWSAKAAASQGVPAVNFATSGSTSFAFFNHLNMHKKFDTFPFEAIRFKDYEIRDLIALGQSANVEEDIGEGHLSGVSCDIVLIKSSRGIEGKYIDYLSKLLDKKVVPTGPLVTYNDHQKSEILKWLRSKSERSTLYISFGSENSLSQGQIGEIAKGLEMSGVNFIWAARLPVGSDIVIEEALPEGFLERVKERGMMVQKWSPQTAILAHPSVGGFMSHCGWGSVVESLYFEVPMLALPLKIDQPLNARLLVEIGVGVEVVRDENGGFDGEGVAKAINEVFGEEGEELRRKAREVSEKMKMEEEEDMSEVAKELSRICWKKWAMEQ